MTGLGAAAWRTPLTALEQRRAAGMAPELAEVAARLEADEVDWSAYRTCGTCRARMGEPCFALSGRVAGGRPDGLRTVLDHAHAHRKRRSGR